MMENKLPEIQILFDATKENPSLPFYRKALYESLRWIIPEGLFDVKGDKSEEQIKKRLQASLPLIRATPVSTSPSVMSFYCLFRYRVNAFKFFFDLVSQWLVPGKRLDVVLVHALDFRFPELGESVYTLCEVMLRVETKEDLESIQKNFPIIETEAILGVDSAYYARKILEIKGISPDQKTALIHQRMATLVKRMPALFSQDLFSEMQHILVLCDDDFKLQRSVRHLSRLISTHYAFRKRLLSQNKQKSATRYLFAKFYKEHVLFPHGEKQVLGIVIGLNFLRDKEVLEQRHLMRAIQQYVPQAEAIDQTFFINRKVQEPIATIYLEIEKNDGTLFTKEELDVLRSKLPRDLQHHVARLTLPVFMPRNEEEIMRNILSLSHQIKYVRDIPQVFISFDEQTERNLLFTIIIVRLLKDNEKSIQEMFKGADSFLKYLHDRTRIVGSLRKKYNKEATVFRVKFPKDKFLRGDHAIDLYKARQAVVSELSRVLGEFRDFNGGMISKQNELINQVRTHLTNEGVKHNDILLENFYYSLSPVIMRTVLEPHAFKSLFQMLTEAQEKGIPEGERCSLMCKYETEFTYVMMSAPHRSILDELSKPLNKFQQAGSDLIQGYAKIPGQVAMGYIFRSADLHQQDQFRQVLAQQIKNLESAFV